MAKQTDYGEFYGDLVEQTQNYKGEKEDIVRLAPELFRFLTNLQNNKKTPKEAKSLIGGAISYFIAPYDGLPEEVYGPLGFMDDIFVSLYVMKKLIPILKERLIKDNWEGEESLQTVLDRVYPEVEEYVRGAAKHILNYVDFMIGK